MHHHHRRGRYRAAELTALLDVLFILLFAALVQAQHPPREAVGPLPEGASVSSDGADAAATAGTTDESAADESADGDANDDVREDTGQDSDIAAEDRAPPADATLDGASSRDLRAQRMASLIASAIRQRDAYVVDVAADGEVMSVEQWRDGARVRGVRLYTHLLRSVPAHESDSELAYRGDERIDERLCSLVLAGQPSLHRDLAEALLVIASERALEDLPRALRDGLMADAGRCFADTGGVVIVVDPNYAASQDGPSSPPSQVPDPGAADHRATDRGVNQ